MINVGKELFSWIPVICTSTGEFSWGPEQRHFSGQHRSQLRYLGGQTVKRLFIRPAIKTRINPAQKKAGNRGKKSPPSKRTSPISYSLVHCV